MKVVFIKDTGLVSRKSRSSILVCYSDDKCREVNVRDIEALVILGSKVKVEAGVISLLSSYNVPTAIVSRLGTSVLTVPVVTLYNEVRRKQYALSELEKEDVVVKILAAKFRGLVNVLKYYGVKPPVLEDVTTLKERYESLLQWEALYSRVFWNKLIELLPLYVINELRSRYGFEGRKPRSNDPFNKSISLLYATLYSFGSRALLAAGLDPTYGFHHKTRYSTPLVYDYTEMFKPIAIHAVIRVLRRTEELPKLDGEGNLTKESINIVAGEFFKLLKARIAGTRYTIYRTIYINAFRLADRIRGSTTTNYTFTYNPKKLKTSEP